MEQSMEVHGDSRDWNNASAASGVVRHDITVVAEQTSQDLLC